MRKQIEIEESPIKWGKRITRIRGIENGRNKEVERKLKKLCATGGTCNETTIMLQGWHGQKVKAALMEMDPEIKESDIQITRIDT